MILPDPSAAAWAMAAVLAAALATWLVSLIKRDVSIVDSLWGPMIALAGWVYASQIAEPGPRTTLVLTLASLWALRLSVYITWRNHGRGEDRRYQAIRARNQPHFEFKSLYLVFGLQALLAWIVAWPLMAGVTGTSAMTWLTFLGAGLWAFGLAFETLADHQMARFKSDLANRTTIMARGLWAWSRHPNYFGECLLWWGAGLVAVDAGAPWALVSPVLMTVLLLRVSGVTLLEKDLSAQRPAYRDYMARTSAFIPWPPRPRLHRPRHEVLS